MNIFGDLWRAVFGVSDEYRAERVLEAYADLDRLTPEEREALAEELELTDEQSSALGRALGPAIEISDGEVETPLVTRVETAADGRITAFERPELREAGFSSEFINTLAGTNGNAALERRAQWLGENAVTRAFRTDCDETERTERLLEVASMGAAGRGVLTYLHEVVRGEDEDDYTPAVRTAALAALLSVVDATPESEDDDEALEVIEDAERPEEILDAMWAIDEDLPADLRNRVFDALARRGLNFA
ncbi:MAG TPA: hypothetical protein VFX30_10985 [bacterium]|nr:hypothetical protein [bacterium]